MGCPSFPPSGRVVSLIEVLPLIGLGVAFGYGSSDIVLPSGERGRTLQGRDEESLLRTH